MTSAKAAGAAAFSASDARVVDQLGGKIDNHATHSIDKLQREILRHRFGLLPATAAVVARLAFGEVRP